jgi:hypothetical protein
MKRDMELVRKFLFQIEDTFALDAFGQSAELQIEGYDSEAIVYHCLLLRDDGLIDAQDCGDVMTPSNIGIQRLTSRGHDFIDAARSDTVWNKTLAKAKENGISLTIDLATQMLKATAKRALGLE